jgi:hypothetical protein
MLGMVANVLRFPFSKVCVHWVAVGLLDSLAANGFTVSEELADAVVRADDETSLRLLDAMIGGGS